MPWPSFASPMGSLGIAVAVVADWVAQSHIHHPSGDVDVGKAGTSAALPFGMVCFGCSYSIRSSH